jgi:hypothetical protein
MTPAIRPRHALTEQAVGSILHTVADLHARPTPTSSRGRIATTSQIAEQGALLRIVSITEAYLDSLSLQEVMRTVPPSPMTSKLVETFETSTTTTWRARRQSFKTHHGIDLVKCARWNDLDAAIDVRNSIAHALGRVTAFLRRNSQLATKVGRIGVIVANGQMLLSDSTVDKVASVCADFIYDVDSKVPIP